MHNIETLATKFPPPPPTLNEPLPPLPSPPPTHSHRKNPIDIRRDRLDEAKFEKGFKPAKISVKERLGKLVVPPEPLKSALKPPCSQQEWLQFLLTHVPILSWVWSYRPGFLIGDFIAGITVAIMHIPQGGPGGVCCTVEPLSANTPELRIPAL